MSKKIKILTDQNILDLAIQETGGVEGAFKIIDLNEGVESLDHVFNVGDEIIIDPADPVEINVRDFYELNGIKATTGEEDAFMEQSFNDDFNDDFS